MYAIDSLMSVYDYSMPGSMDYVLSAYFLKNALSLHHQRLIDVSLKTHVSSSSIIRFCKSGGYRSFSLFCDVIFQEAKKIEHDLKHIHGHHQVDDFLMEALKQTEHVIFYGDISYIHLFYRLIQDLFLHGVSVDQCQCWNQRKYDDLFGHLKQTDVLIIVEPHYSLPIFLEEIGTSNRINGMEEMKAQKFYISANKQSFNDIRSVPIDQGNDDYVSSCIALSHDLIEGLRVR